MKRIIAMLMTGILLSTSIQMPVMAAQDDAVEVTDVTDSEEVNSSVSDSSIDDTDEGTEEIVVAGDSGTDSEELTGENADLSRVKDPRSSDGVVTWDCVYFGNYWQNDTNGDGTADQKDEKEKIKWRVLSVSGNDAFLVADQNLDCKKYNEIMANVTWEICTLRSWLNRDFMNAAFSSEEQSAIKKTTVVNADNPDYETPGGNNTEDQIFLLSYDEALNKRYGFSAYFDVDPTRTAKNTAYAKVQGAYTSTSTGYEGNGWWRLRSPGERSDTAVSVHTLGYVGSDGINVDDGCYGAVRPALHLDLSSSLWQYAGTVTSEGDVNEPEENADLSKVKDPRSSNGVVTWDCVYFGNYWQNDTNGDGTANQNDSKEKIKWRVLSVSGNDAFLVADQSLDCKKYHETGGSVTWENCALRSWLNGDFMNAAFSSEEQSAIKKTTVVNADNPEYGTPGGNNTLDQIFLLSYDEAINNRYGFNADYAIYDPARCVKNTAYAKARGAYTSTSTGYEGNGWWWLRSPGYSNYALIVKDRGTVYRNGNSVYSYDGETVRPALHLNLSSSLWQYAGTVTSEGDVNEQEENADLSKVKNPISSNGVVTWDCVYFGNYWQNDTNGDGTANQNDIKEKIKWRVLSVSGNDAFLVADQSLDCKKYHETGGSVTWENCTLRSWLNEDFMNAAFSSEEQSAISLTTVVNADNIHHETSGGNNTEDRIFLLSYDEAVNDRYGFHTDYENEDPARYAKNTEYTRAQGAYTATKPGMDRNGWWWLRSPGHSSSWAMDVAYYGGVYSDGHDVSSDKGVRPALHLNLSSSLWQYAGTVTSAGDVKEPGKYTVDSRINGKGYGTYSFLLEDDKGTVLENREISYFFKDSKGNVLQGNYTAKSDENGFITIKTKVYDNTSKLTNSPMEDTLVAYLVYKPDGSTNVLSGSNIVFHITVDPPSFSESWSLLSEISAKGTIGAGAAIGVGAAQMDASVAEASATAGVGNTVSVTNQYASGVRWLELGNEYSANLGLSGSLGLSASGKVGGELGEVDVSLAKLSAGAKAGGKAYSGLKIKDYVPGDSKQLKQMGGFMLGTSAIAKGNAALAALFVAINEKYNHEFSNVVCNSVNVGVEGGAEMGTVSASLGGYEMASGSIMNLEGDCRYSYSQRYDDYDNPSKKPIYVMEKENYGAGKFLAYNVNPVGFEGGLYDKDGYTNSYRLESRDDSFLISSYRANGSTNAGLTTFRVNDCLEFKGDARTQLLNQVDMYRDFSNGKSKLFLDSLFQEGAQKWTNSGIESSYSEMFEKTDSVTTGEIGLDFGLGAGAFVELGGGMKLTGTYSDQYELASGYFKEGNATLTAVTDIGSDTDAAGNTDVSRIVDPAEKYKLGKDGAVNLIQESLSVIGAEVKEHLTEIVSEIKDKVSNAWCSVAFSAKNLKNRFVRIVTINRTGMKNSSNAETNIGDGNGALAESYPSFEIMTYEKADAASQSEGLTGAAGDRLTGTAVTIGDSYMISVLEQDKETVVDDFSDTPFALTLSYSDEMLAKAGVEAADEGKIEIFKYVEEDCGYVSIGGTVDKENNAVTVLNITKPGQFILAFQENAGEQENPVESWLEPWEKTSDTTYIVNLATKQKIQIPELAKTKADGKKYKITYSPKNIAAMSTKGLIQAKKVGKTTITLKKGDQEYTIEVNVYNPQFTYANKKQKYFEMNAGEKFLPVYENCQLKPAFSIPKSCKTATINAETGELTAIKRGSVTVTATVGEGKMARMVKTTVRIYDPAIKLSKSKVTVGKKIQASIKYGKKATEWKSLNPEIAAIDDKGRITGVSAGTATIEAVSNKKTISANVIVAEPKSKKK